MKKFDYNAAWQRAADFESKALPESELKEVNEIYAQANAEKNTGQIVKAIIHQIKLIDYKEENSFVKNLIKVNEEIKKAEFPAKPLLHSMLADLYWQYYQNNRWKYNNRTETVNLKEDDIETWGLEKIVQETIKHYEASLQDKDKLQAESIKIYDEVLYKGNEEGRALRPTLYDFLANRAIDFYMSEEPSITRPAYFFTLNKPEYLSEAESFVNLKIETKDTLAMKFYALLHLQDLMKFHLGDQKPDALVYTDLKRLRFVRQYLTNPDKDLLFENALNRLEEKSIKSPVSTLVTYEIAVLYTEYARLYNPLQSDNHKWELKKAYEICEKAKSRFKESSGTAKCASLQENILDKKISARVEERNLPVVPFKAYLNYANIQKVYYRIIKTTKDEISTQRKKWERNYDVDRELKFMQHYLAKSPVKTGSHTLPDDGDYQNHSVEIKLDGIPAGEYMVLLSHHPDFKTENNSLSYSFTTITSISYVHRNTNDGGTEFFILNRETGEPLAGVTAAVFFEEYNYKKSEYENVAGPTLVSNSEGYLKVPYQFNKKESYSRNFFVNFSLGSDRVSTNSLDAHYSVGTFYQSKHGEPYTTTQVLFFMDRAIYRPGQTIYFKGIILSTDGKKTNILPKTPVTVTFYDVNSQKVADLNLTSNEYGTFNGTFIAPTKGLMGQMRLETYNGSIGFSVEEYKRPKFEVKFEPVKGTFRLNETITAVGEAKAYSGAGIDGAKVKYRVVRRARYPYWWFCKWGYYPTSPEIEIANGFAETDGAGKFKIDFKALPDPLVDKASDPTFSYTIYADVTDINGETHSKSTVVSVGYKALQVSVDISDLDKEDADTWKDEKNIRTTNLAGEFEPAKGQISIYSLKQPEKVYRERLWPRPDRQLLSESEFRKTFQLDEYNEENNSLKWTRDKEVFKHDFDTEKRKTLSIEGLKKLSSGRYVLEITSKDKYGQDVKEVTYFTLYSVKDNKLAVPEIDHLESIVPVVEPGEKAKLLIGTSSDKVKVLYEIEKDETIIYKEWITLKDEQKLLEIPIKEEYRGNIAIHYTFILNNRLYYKSETVSVPYTNKELDINFETFRDKLQPGENEEWKIKISGKNSDKIAAEMVATLYDASLDVFRFHSWHASFNHYMYATLGWGSTNGFNEASFNSFTRDWNVHKGYYYGDPYFDHLQWFNYTYYHYYYRVARYRMDDYEMEDRVSDGVMRKESTKSKKAMPSPSSSSTVAGMAMEESESFASADTTALVEGNVKNDKDGGKKDNKGSNEDFSDVKVRSNFNETAFFYPDLQTNEKGELIIKFTIPEALTR